MLLAATTVLVLAGAPSAPSLDAAAPPDPGRDFTGAAEVGVPPPVDAETLYQQGEQAYWLGDFNLAVEKFEAAYAASQLPALLYNVGLAYLRRFEISHDTADLERARAVLRNYTIELDKDPSLGQADNVPKLLKQIDELLAKHAPAAVTKAPEGPVTCPEAPAAPPPAPAPPRPVRPLGIAVMAGSSLVLAGGVAATLAFAFKGRSFQQQLVGLRADQAAENCDDVSSATCTHLAESVRVTTDNGRLANVLAGGLGGGLSALGLAGLVVGAVVHSKQNTASRARAGLRVTPALGGLVLHGAF